MLFVGGDVVGWIWGKARILLGCDTGPTWGHVGLTGLIWVVWEGVCGFGGGREI